MCVSVFAYECVRACVKGIENKHTGVCLLAVPLCACHHQ